jgi:cobalamin biosynthesis Mg chelatase CobN
LFDADTPLLDALTKARKLDVADESRIVAAVSVWERQLRDYTSMAERARRDVDTLLMPALSERSDIGSLLVGPFITPLNGADPMWRVPVVINIDTEI